MSEDRNLLYSWNGVRSVANPFTHFHHNTPGLHDFPTSRPARPADVSATLSAASTELLDYLEASGYAPQELSDTAAALGYTEEQLERWAADEERGELPFDESYRRMRLAAAMMEGIIVHKATVGAVAILKASPQQLREYEGFYSDTLAEIWTDIRTLENTLQGGDYTESPKWCVLEAKLRKFAAYQWMVRARLGVGLFDGNLIVQNAPHH